MLSKIFGVLNGIMTTPDLQIARRILSEWRKPDLIISPDGKPYLYRWHLIPHNDFGNVYFHIQVDSDPERPLHDHPWANTSVILSGGYDEIWDPQPWLYPRGMQVEGTQRRLRAGDVIHRSAGEAHRLLMLPGYRYTMTLFSTGPKVRRWGFWFPDGWRDADDVTHLDPTTHVSVMTQEARGDAKNSG